MKKYNVVYNGKNHTVTANNSVEAVEKFLDRPLFGNTAWNGGFRVDMYDADTEGEKWCKGVERWGNKPIYCEEV